MKGKRILWVLMIILMMQTVSTFLLEVRVDAASTTHLGNKNASFNHFEDDPNGWAKQSNGNYLQLGGTFIRTDVNQLRANWHQTLGPGIALGGLAYDSPTGYTPPSGYEIHSIASYAVYNMRTYDVQKEESGCKGGTPNDNRCNPYHFAGDAGENNNWAKPPNIASANHWVYYTTESRFNPGRGKYMEYYRWRTAQIRKEGHDGLGAGGTPLLKYDFKIIKSKTPPVNPPTGKVACPPPNEVPLRYEHELDLEVYRLDARTVDINTNTETDVYAKRTDFSGSRDAAKKEFYDYIKETEAYKVECGTLIAGWELEKANAESAITTLTSELAKCNATVVKPGDPPVNCTGYDAQISVQVLIVAEKTALIDAGKLMLPIYDEKIALAEKELTYIESNESKYSVVTPDVQLTYQGANVGSIIVSLSEGETKLYTFPLWKPTAQDKDIMAQINGNGPYQEFYYTDIKNRVAESLGYNTTLGHVLYPNNSSNNWKDVTQRIATYNTASCPPPTDVFKEQTIEDIVRTINENGNRREIKEQLNTKFTKVPREKMRAGYGFEYELTTIYRNMDTEPNPSNATGTKITESYFTSMVDYQPYKRGGSKPAFDLNGNPVPNTGIDEGYRVGMQTTQPNVSRNETKAWILPPVAIEEFSGNIFTTTNNEHIKHVERNPSENLLTHDKKGNLLTRWYTPFTEPDGNYLFKVRTYDAGVNHLNTCHIGNVIIDGVIIGEENGNDDYVKRAITPDNPFPSGTGWNWYKQESNLTSLSEWYFNWESNPKNLPLSSYRNALILTPETLSDIRRYNFKHPKFIVGDSVHQDVNITRGK